MIKITAVRAPPPPPGGVMQVTVFRRILQAATALHTIKALLVATPG